MTGRRAAGILAALAVAAAAGIAWWILRGEGTAPPAPGAHSPVPPPERPAPVDPPGIAPRRAAAAPNAGAKAALRPPATSPEAEDPPPVPKGRPPENEIWARLRLVEAGTGKPIPADAEPAVTMSVHRGWRVDLVPQRVYLEDDGRLAVAASAAGESALTESDVASARYATAAYGYAARGGFTKAELAGEHEVALVAALPAATGILVAGPGVQTGPVRSEIHPVDGRVVPRIPGVRQPRLPRALGPFAIHDLDPGKWRLSVLMTQTGNLPARGSVEFERAEGTADLGRIEIRGYSALRVRVVTADGTPILDPGLDVARPGVEVPEPMTAELQFDAEGWTDFRGLEPGGEFVVRSPTFGVEETVRAPAAGDPPLKVELRRDVRLVQCRIRFTVDGKDPVQWGDWLGGPLLAGGSWRRDGHLEHAMIPGEYTVDVMAQPVGADGLRRVQARFAVPDRPAWDATVDLKEER